MPETDVNSNKTAFSRTLVQVLSDTLKIMGMPVKINRKYCKDMHKVY